MGKIGRGRALASGLGDFGDDDVRVARVLGPAMGQATRQDRPTGRVQRHRVRTTVEADGAFLLVDRGAPQQPQFSG